MYVCMYDAVDTIYIYIPGSFITHTHECESGLVAITWGCLLVVLFSKATAPACEVFENGRGGGEAGDLVGSRGSYVFSVVEVVD